MPSIVTVYVGLCIIHTIYEDEDFRRKGNDYKLKIVYSWLWLHMVNGHPYAECSVME